MKKIYFFILCYLFAGTPGNAQWSLTGNSISSTNFLGTTNGYPLIFKVNNNSAGTIESNGSTANAFFGSLAGNVNTGINNAGFGFEAMMANTSGHSNLATGFQALYANSTGSYNTAVGNDVMYRNTTGNFNNAIGSGALFSNTTGAQNVANGANALFYNTTGSDNVAEGTAALYFSTGTSSTVAIGDSALYNQSGSPGWNTAVGSLALFSNTSGNGNTALGYHSVYSCTTGTSNTGIGYAALYGTTTGSLNVAIGPGALTDNQTGQQNVATGYLASYFSTGSYNTAYGAGALETNTSGNENTGIGAGADVNQPTYTNSTMIGCDATATQSNEVILGNTSVTLIGGSVGWSVISDGRYKKNIKENVPGLEFINQLRPVTYTLDVTGLNQFLRPQSAKTADGKSTAPPPIDANAIKQKEQVSYSGFIAQDVEASAKKIGYDYSGVHIPAGDKDLYSLDYAKFVVPLVKAVQELSNSKDSLISVVDSLRAAQTNMQTQINTILRQLNNLKTTAFSGDAPQLKQNAPNPFNNTTTIDYYLPPSTSKAWLTIRDAAGHVLRSVELDNKGQGQATINAGDLAAGSYFYTLVVNDRIIATRQMILTP